jgi:hypothetical protein
MLRHLMVDIETWGKAPGCMIRSIGAVFFDFDNDIGAQFYVNVEDQSCAELGLTKDASTVEWWAGQSEEARAGFASPEPVHIIAALDRFYRFAALGGADVMVWAHGLSFDLPILKHVGALARMKEPWRYNNERDTRTIHWLHGPLAEAGMITREGTYHNALDDCLHQVKVLRAHLRNENRKALLDLVMARISARPWPGDESEALKERQAVLGLVKELY